MKKSKTVDAIEKLAPRCESEEKKDLKDLLTKIGDKWSILLIVLLSRAPEKKARFSELLALVDGISQRMLTTTLRSLERDGYVKREVFPVVPPRVEYSLSALGASLLLPLEHLVEWTLANRSAIHESRAAYDGRTVSGIEIV
ncbi:MAG: transcriptional regulator [Proteobacteria bacterium]|nr:MAG: transcriptional regulator [Pseudomonadota bacterium]